MQKKYLYLGLVLFFLGLSSTVIAQSSSVTVRRPFADDDLKSVSKARFIALTNTALSIGTGLAAVSLFDNDTVQRGGAILGAYGIIMAPSTGNMYAQDYPRALVGIGARAIGAYLMLDATSEIFGTEFADQLNVDDEDVSLTDTKVLIGEALVLGGMVYSILSSKKSVEQYNATQAGFAFNINSAKINDKVAPVLTARYNF